jgi:hypothetical protein
MADAESAGETETGAEAAPPLPAELARLFPDGGAGRTLPVELPAGRLVMPSLDGGGPSEEPAAHQHGDPCAWRSGDQSWP